MILGAMVGYWGYRPLAELPSYSTFRHVMQQLDDQVLAQVFTDWAQNQQAPAAGEWFAAAGKSIRSSVTDDDQAEQNACKCSVGVFASARRGARGLSGDSTAANTLVELMWSGVGKQPIEWHGWRRSLIFC